MNDPRGPHHDAPRRTGRRRKRTFLDDLRRGVLDYPGRAAVVARDVADDTKRILDYSELEQLADRCAAGFVELGLVPGDVVAVQLPDRWEPAPLVLGCVRAGLRLFPLAPDCGEEELEHALRLTEARMLITMPEPEGMPPAGTCLRLAGELPALEHVAVADPAPPGALDLHAHFFDTPWAEKHGLGGLELGPDAPFLMLITLDATGEPEVTMHTQNTLYAGAGEFGTHHAGLVRGMLMPLTVGGTMDVQETWAGSGPLGSSQSEPQRRHDLA